MVLRLAGARHCIGLELPEVLVLREDVVLSRGDQQHAQRRVLGHHVTGNLHGGRRQGDRLDQRAHRVNHVHGQLVGGQERSHVRAAGGHAEERLEAVRERAARAALRHIVAVAGRRLHGVHGHIGKVRVVGHRNAPLDVVLIAPRASHVHQQRLVKVAVHQTLRHRTAQTAIVHGRAQARHGVAQVNREARLIDADARLVVAQAGALALGIIAAHDRVSAHRLQEVELNLVALAARQVHRLDDGHISGGLLANDVRSCGLALGHGARQAAQRGIALHGLREQASSLNKHGLRITCGHRGFRGH